MSSKKIDVQEILVSVPEYIQRVKCDTNKGTKPFKCAVRSCRNKFRNFRERLKYPYKFHQFPSVNPKLCKKWKEICGLDTMDKIDDLMVCSDHFNLDDYVRNYKEEFGNPNFKRKLKRDAVPSKNCDKTVVGTNDREMEKDEDAKSDTSIKLELSESIDSLDKSESIKSEPIDVSIKSELKETPNKSAPGEGELELVTAVKQNTVLYTKYCDLLKAESKLQKEIADNRETIKNFKLKVANTQKLKHKTFTLSRVFSPAQIELLRGNKKKIYWTDDDLARAFTMRHMGGRECYLYLKDTIGIPLPALSCVQKWATSVNESDGGDQTNNIH